MSVRNAESVAEWKGPLRGHGLLYEGWPYRHDGTRYFWKGGWGHGKCSCGLLGPDLPNENQRKKWHRQHKAEVAEQFDGGDAHA